MRRPISDVDVSKRVVFPVLREHVAVQVRRPVPHHEIVDLPGREGDSDGPTRPLHVTPERAEFTDVELGEVGDMFAKDDHGVSGVSLIAHETKVRGLS